jgi:hypothetical protein
VLDDSKAFAEALLLEGDPQKKVAKLVIDYITDSLSDYMEGKTQVIPKPWHVFEEGEGEVYIFVSDLRKKVTEYAMTLHQRDIAYRYDEHGRYAVSEREWEKVEPEIAEVLNGRQFIALLKKFFPNNVREHRKSPIFIISKDTWDKLNFDQPPTRAETEKNTPGLTRQNSTFYKENSKNPTLDTPQFSPEFRSDCHSEIKIQNKGIENKNSKSHLELNENPPLQFTNKNSKWQKIDSAQFPLDCHSEIKLLSGNYSNPPLGKNSSAQDMTAHQQQILDFLKKLSEKIEGRMRLSKLSNDELKLLPELREKGYVNFDDIYVWLTMEGYIYLTSLSDKKSDDTGNSS